MEPVGAAPYPGMGHVQLIGNEEDNSDVQVVVPGVPKSAIM